MFVTEYECTTLQSGKLLDIFKNKNLGDSKKPEEYILHSFVEIIRS